MKPIDSRIEPLLAELSSDPALPVGAEQDIRRVITESQYLSNLVADAAEKGQLDRIAVSHGKHNAGHFEDGQYGKPDTAYIGDSVFKDPTLSEGARLDHITEVLGHETMHAVLADQRRQVTSEFDNKTALALGEAFADQLTSVDLTPQARELLNSGRQMEALAEVSAFRALNSRIKEEMPGATEGQVEKALLDRSRTSCVDRADVYNPQFAPGITYQALTQHPYQHGEALTEATAQCFYDNGGSTLGRHGDSNYANYYAPTILSTIANARDALPSHRRAPDIRLDLHALGIDAQQIERNGVDLGKASALTINDQSPNAANPGWVQVKNTGAKDPAAPDQAPPSRPLTPADSDHPDHALLEQIRTGVRMQDEKMGRAYDEGSERLSRSLLAVCKDTHENSPQQANVSGLEITQATHVALGNDGRNMFVMQGNAGDPAHKRVYVDVAYGMNTPVEQSDAKLQAAHQTLTQERERAQQQELAQGQHQNGPKGPAM